MGYKVLYEQLKKTKRIFLYDEDIVLWEDYLPDDIKLFAQYETNYNKNPHEIYYSEKLDEYYVKIITDYVYKIECSIDLYDSNSFVYVLIKSELCCDLNDDLKEKFGFNEKI